jgi:Zn-dependent metalloprotease
MNGESIFTDSQVVRDARTGRPLKIRGEFELPVFDIERDSIKAFLFANADDLSLAMQPKDLNKIQDVETPTGRVMRYQQMQDGIPILGTEIQVRLDRASRVKQVDLAHVPAGNGIQPKGDEKALKAAAALTAANEAIGAHKVRQKVASPTIVYFPTPEGLRAYPKNPAALNAIHAHAK